MKRVNAKHVTAITMLVKGETVDAVAKAVGVSAGTVHNWMRQPDIQAMYREALGAEAYSIIGDATSELRRQLRDTNTWVRQGAVREAFARFGVGVLAGSDGDDVRVQVIGAPEIGMPER